MVIAHNISAINTYKSLGMSGGSVNKAMEKLSSGFRINKAADDAAGLSISEKMRSQIRGLNQASKNAENGISMIQTAEGALNEVHSILQRMRELAVEAATDTNADEDREALQGEISQLINEVDRIGVTTEFNGIKLFNLDGRSISGTGGSTPPGPFTPELTANANIASAVTSKLSSLGVDGGSLTENGDGTYSYSVKSFSKGDTFTIGSTDYKIGTGNKVVLNTSNLIFKQAGTPALTNSDLAIYDNVDDAVTALKAAGYKRWHGDTSKAFSFSQATNYDTAGSKIVKFESGGYKITYDVNKNTVTVTSGDLYDANGSKITSLTPGVHVSVASNNQGGMVSTYNVWTKGQTFDTPGLGVLTFTSATSNPTKLYTNRISEDIKAADFKTQALNDGNTYVSASDAQTLYKNQALTLDGTTINVDGKDYDVQVETDGSNLKFSVYTKGSSGSSGGSSGAGGTGGTGGGSGIQEAEITFHVGANSNQIISCKLRNMNSEELEIESIDVSTRINANDAIDIVDEAIKSVSNMRSTFGAIQNRLEYTINNLNTTGENMTAAESTIRDVDMADQMMEYTKSNILQQAAQAMLIQANARPQQALQLLRV